MHYTERHKVIMTALFPLGPIVFAISAYICYYVFLFLMENWWFVGTDVDVEFLAVVGALLAGGIITLSMNTLIWGRKPEQVPDAVAFFPLIGLLAAGAAFFLVRGSTSDVIAFLIGLLVSIITGILVLLVGSKLVNSRSNKTSKVF